MNLSVGPVGPVGVGYLLLHLVLCLLFGFVVRLGYREDRGFLGYQAYPMRYDWGELEFVMWY